MSDIEDYFEHIIEKHETLADNPLIRIHVNEVENRITFKVKTGDFLELLTSERLQ